MRTDLVGRVSRLFHDKPPAPRGPRAPRRRRTLVVLIVAAALAAVAVPIAASSGATNRHWFIAERDGLGIRPGKIKHVWLIILENKSYDASFTGLNNNTYLWQTLPSQGVLLKNYYGTGHFSLDNYVSLVSGQATAARHAGRLPRLRRVHRGTGRPAIGRPLDRPTRTTARPSRPPARTPPPAERLRLPGERADAVQPARRRQRELEGLRPGSRQRPTRPDPVTRRGGSAQPWLDCGAPYAVARTDRRAPRSPTPAARTRPTSTCPSTSRSRGSSRSCSPATATRRTSPTCSTRPTASTTTCRARRRRRRSAGSRRTTAATPTTRSATATTSRAASPTRTRPNAPVNYTGGLYAADLFLEHVIPEIEASPAFKDGGLIDITFDEAFPPFTYTGNSFANSTIVSPNAATLGRVRHGRRDALRPQRQLRADRPEHAACDRRAAATSSTRARVTTPTSTGRATASPRRFRRSPPAPACWAAAATSRARAPTPRRPAPSRQRHDHRPLDRRDRRRPRGDAAPASRPGAFVGQVVDSPTVPATAPPTRRRCRHRLLHARRRPGRRRSTRRPRSAA